MITHLRFQVDKVVQMYETMMTKHATMVVGPTGGGKSVVINTLCQAQSKWVQFYITFLNVYVDNGNPSFLSFSDWDCKPSYIHWTLKPWMSLNFMVFWILTLMTGLMGSYPASSVTSISLLTNKSGGKTINILISQLLWNTTCRHDLWLTGTSYLMGMWILCGSRIWTQWWMTTNSSL